MFYFQTDSSFGYVTDEDQIPDGATQIDQAQYDLLVQAAADAQAAEFQAQLQAAYQVYLDTFGQYCAMGLPANVAATMAEAAGGIKPPDFDPSTCPPAP